MRTAYRGITGRISQLEKGEHPEFKNKCIAFEQEKHSAVKQAERRKQDQIDNINSLFDFELKAGDDVYNHKVKEQKERMLEEWKQKLKRARDESEGNPWLTASAWPRDNCAVKQPKKMMRNQRVLLEPLVLGYSRQLPDDDIMKDLRAIHNDWKQHASKFSAASSYEVKVFVKNGQLYYKDLVLEKGHTLWCFQRLLKKTCTASSRVSTPQKFSLRWRVGKRIAFTSKTCATGVAQCTYER